MTVDLMSSACGCAVPDSGSIQHSTVDACNFATKAKAAFKDEPGKGEIFCQKLREALAPFSDLWR